MNTFDAIAEIRKQDMTRPDALKFLIERLGLNVTYAGEIAAVVFDERREPSKPEESANRFAKRSA
jgi:hypothetical protein